MLTSTDIGALFALCLVSLLFISLICVVCQQVLHAQRTRKMLHCDHMLRCRQQRRRRGSPYYYGENHFGGDRSRNNTMGVEDQQLKSQMHGKRVADRQASINGSAEQQNFTDIVGELQTEKQDEGESDEGKERMRTKMFRFESKDRLKSLKTRALLFPSSSSLVQPIKATAAAAPANFEVSSIDEMSSKLSQKSSSQIRTSASDLSANTKRLNSRCSDPRHYQRHNPHLPKTFSPMATLGARFSLSSNQTSAKNGKQFLDKRKRTKPFDKCCTYSRLSPSPLIDSTGGETPNNCSLMNNRGNSTLARPSDPVDESVDDFTFSLPLHEQRRLQIHFQRQLQELQHKFLDRWDSLSSEQRPANGHAWKGSQVGQNDRQVSALDHRHSNWSDRDGCRPFPFKPLLDRLRPSRTPLSCRNLNEKPAAVCRLQHVRKNVDQPALLSKTPHFCDWSSKRMLATDAAPYDQFWLHYNDQDNQDADNDEPHRKRLSSTHPTLSIPSRCPLHGTVVLSDSQPPNTHSQLSNDS